MNYSPLLAILPSLHPHLPSDIQRSIERPMKIEIVVDPARPVPPASLASRVAPAAAAAAAPVEATPRLVSSTAFGVYAHTRIPFD